MYQDQYIKVLMKYDVINIHYVRMSNDWRINHGNNNRLYIKYIDSSIICYDCNHGK